MNPAPPIDILDSLVVADRDRDIPLHVQIRKAMRRVIDEHFEDGQQFWTEQALIERLNVSQITVRRALNDLAKDGLLVRRAAKGTIIRKPNIAEASELRVALFVARYTSEILNAAIENVARVCHERNLRFHVYYTFKGQTVSETLNQMEHGADAQRVMLLGLPTDLSLAMLDLLGERGYRALTLDTAAGSGRSDGVGFDDRAGIEIALSHLTSLGHRRITLLVNEPGESVTVIRRVEAFRELSAGMGIETEIVSCGAQFWESAHDKAYAAMPGVWQSDFKPTAILTVSDAGAWAVLKWLADHKIRVPDDVSVMGFDDDRLSAFTTPSLTTLGRNWHLLAERALDTLCAPKSSKQEILIRPHLIERMSTAVPGGNKMPEHAMPGVPDERFKVGNFAG